MPGVFNSLIDRTDASPLIPTQEANEVVKTLPQASAALALCRRVNMGTKLVSVPVLSALSSAYWVNGDTGLKQTSDLAWKGADLTAEEIAVIVPIPDNVVADSGIPIWSEIRPIIAAEVGRTLDQAVFSGINKPATWPNGIIPGAVAAGNVNEADSTPQQGGAANDLVETFDAVESDGYDVSGIAAAKAVRGLLRKARDANGQKLADISTGQFEGVPLSYVQAGVFGATDLAVVGDFSMSIVGIRQDLTWKLLDQAVLTDDTGAVIANLAQQDMTALRVVARFGFAVANPITHDQATDAQRYPFSVLQNVTP